MDANTANNQVQGHQVTVTLIQHWAQMVNENQARLERQSDTIADLQDRLHLVLHDNYILRQMLDEQFNETETESNLALALSRLIATMLNENRAFEVYRNDYLEIINGNAAINVIDLTADEDLE